MSLTQEIREQMDEIRADPESPAMPNSDMPREELPGYCEDWRRWADKMGTHECWVIAEAAIRLAMDPRLVPGD